MFEYDLNGNVRRATDPNGSVVTKEYDALDRLTKTEVARGYDPVRGIEVLGTTLEEYKYDGLSRLTFSSDDNGGVSAETTVSIYDSLSRLIEEQQNGAPVSSEYSRDGKRTALTYPSGRRIEYRDHDALDRIRKIIDVATGRTITESFWAGPGRREVKRVNGLGGHFKTGHTGTGQNRPTDGGTGTG